MNYIDNYRKWMDSPIVDEETKAELASLDEADREYRFFAPLSFGTAGLRGKMGAGLNAMNVYTVAWATQGVADYIVKSGMADRGFVIGRDSRNNSDLFERISARVLAANGVKVYCFDGIRPTPVLSFAIRELGAIGGINITASHNPKEYNGYKVYWEDGAQIGPEQAKAISEGIASTDIFDGVKTCDYDEAVRDGRIITLDGSVDEAFLTKIRGEQVYPDAVQKAAEDLAIVYTPLHGTGYKMVPEILSRIGIKHIYPVEEQMIPNGDFPTAPFPNPELPQVFELGIKLAEEKGSDLIIATDPDADRMGVMARGKNGFQGLTGNQMGVLLLDYIITALKEQDIMPELPYAVKTIVTSEMTTAVCEASGVTLHNVLTGFKFIGGVIADYEKAGKGAYLFGFEESYGYLKGGHARDKDAVVASMLCAEMAAYYHNKGMTLIDAMDALYEKYGVYREKTVDVYMEGLDGLARMKALMDGLRAAAPVDIAGEKVVEVRDYKSAVITDLISGQTRDTGLPVSDVLYYRTEKDNVVVIRPSGTEPKVKMYLLLHAPTVAEADALLAAFHETVSDWTK